MAFFIPVSFSLPAAFAVERFIKLIQAIRRINAAIRENIRR